MATMTQLGGGTIVLSKEQEGLEEPKFRNEQAYNDFKDSETSVRYLVNGLGYQEQQPTGFWGIK